MRALASPSPHGPHVGASGRGGVPAEGLPENRDLLRGAVQSLLGEGPGRYAEDAVLYATIRREIWQVMVQRRALRHTTALRDADRA